MKSIIALAVSLFITQSAYAGCGGFGPGGCEFPVTPVETPERFCFAGVCNNVEGQWFGEFYVVRSVLVTGFPVMGWGGPCATGNCPDIANQAMRNMQSNADIVNRAWYR